MRVCVCVCVQAWAGYDPKIMSGLYPNEVSTHTHTHTPFNVMQGAALSTSRPVSSYRVMYPILIVCAVCMYVRM